MKVIDPGHVYELDWLDGEPGVESPACGEACLPARLTFVKRQGPGYPGNVGAHAGTNCQEVLRALIDRVKYLNGQEPSVLNADVVYHLRGAIMALEARAADRHGRRWRMPFMDIETRPTCNHCGHIGCAGGCRD